MTIRIGQDAYGHHRLSMTRAKIPTSLYKPKSVMGIERQTGRERTAQDRPLTERHGLILEQVTVEPIAAKRIAEILGMKRNGVTSSLYALQDRGLVSRVPYKGWVRVLPR